MCTYTRPHYSKVLSGKSRGRDFSESKEACEGRDGEARQEGQIPGSDEILEGFSDSVKFLGTEIGYEEVTIGL